MQLVHDFILQRMPTHPPEHQAGKAELIILTLQRWLSSPETAPADREQLAAGVVEGLPLRLAEFFSGGMCSAAVALVNTVAAAAEEQVKMQLVKCTPLVEGAHPLRLVTG